jgi:hypothetical protein
VQVSVRKRMIDAMHRARAARGGYGAQRADAKEDTEALEYFVDGGCLNNYPIEAFDGWWLSMKPEDSFYRRLIGSGGHGNYLKRFTGFNPSVLGFRLNAASQPDAMQARLGNDKLELKARSMA